MRLLIAPLLVLLAGCWTGDRFYRASDARAAIPAGLYRSFGEDEPGIVRVTLLANGMTRIGADDGRRPSVLGFVPLDSGQRRFVVFQAQDTGVPIGDDIGLYSLLERRRSGEFVFSVPMCPRTATVAAAFGAQLVSDGENPVECRFPSRESLEAALRRFAPQPSETIRLVRVDEP